MVKKIVGDKPDKKGKESAKEEDIPNWVSDEIQNAKFEKPEELKRTGYILEIYDSDNKIDTQMYDSVEDGRHIVTLDLPKKIKSSDLEKGVVYEFTFDQHRAPLTKKVVEYLQKEKEIEMNTIYKFELKKMELLEVGTNNSVDNNLEE
ncbi:MAG: hypothetical protein ITD33_01060 [Nitrosarchaeum sp.]|nr:hypothetical protein [Nitrosarchaeum sp.]MBP0119443.1 hypothetical protein [Nitrosarchaeum sp.]MBP0134676.1 hypothetical protein [Nitrosarchaeum sp.]